MAAEQRACARWAGNYCFCPKPGCKHAALRHQVRSWECALADPDNTLSSVQSMGCEPAEVCKVQGEHFVLVLVSTRIVHPADTTIPRDLTVA
jgi:hypothetical protein